MCGKLLEVKKREHMLRVQLLGEMRIFKRSSSLSLQATTSTPTKQHAFMSYRLIKLQPLKVRSARVERKRAAAHCFSSAATPLHGTTQAAGNWQV